MRFGPSFIERLRSHFLISEVIGKRIPIKKHGREYHALCPFHNEKTPSFTINDEKGFFHCFGCAAHGDAIEFIKRYERLTYPETIEYLAREAGIELPKPTFEDTRKYEAEKTLYDVMDAAAKWFEQQLAGAHGAFARSYAERRGLKAETIERFRIGYAPDDRTALTNHLLKEGFSHALQIEAGLAIKPDEGLPYDRFRGRLMFAIRNASGKVIAFGGRLLAEQPANATHKLAKYLNSPETPLFHKGEMLYNLDIAKRPAREKNMIVVMEGYMDVVMSAQADIPFAVATLGTAVTPEHLRLLWQLAKEPVMCLDGDAAGKRAMNRAAEIALPLLRPGHSLRFMTLPQGEDPDTYVQKHGKAAFEKLLISAKLLSEILWDNNAASYNMQTPEGRVALEDALKKIAAQIADQSVRQHYLSYFKERLWEASRGKKKTIEVRSPQIEHMAVRHHSAGLETLSRRLLKTLLEYPQLLHKSHVEESLSRIDMAHPALDGLRQVLLETTHLHEDELDNREAFIAKLKAQVHGDLVQSILNSSNALAPMPLSILDAGKLWVETICAYEIAHIDAEIDALQERMGQQMDEASFQQLVELKAARDKAAQRRTFAPAETDVA